MEDSSTGYLASVRRPLLTIAPTRRIVPILTRIESLLWHPRTRPHPRDRVLYVTGSGRIAYRSRRRRRVIFTDRLATRDPSDLHLRRCTQTTRPHGDRDRCASRVPPHFYASSPMRARWRPGCWPMIGHPGQRPLPAPASRSPKVLRGCNATSPPARRPTVDGEESRNRPLLSDRPGVLSTKLGASDAVSRARVGAYVVVHK